MKATHGAGPERGARPLTRRTFITRGAALGGTAMSASSLSAFLAACGGSSETAPSTKTPMRGGLLNAAISGEPDVLDPAKSTLAVASEVHNEIFSKLVDVAPDGKVLPQLATRWDLQDDRTWVFDLRDGVKFHNGEAFSSKDVQYTFERILDKKTGSTYASNFGALEGIEPMGPTRVAFHLKQPFAPFLVALANYGQIVNQRAIEGGKASRQPVGTGPFQFVSWNRGDRITLKRFPGYFEKGRPYLDDVVFNIREPIPTNIDALRSGELHYLDQIPAQSIKTVRSDPTFNYVTSDNAGLPKFLAFGVQNGAMKNKKVRQAIAWAIDRKAIRDVAFFGSGEVGSEEMPTGSSWYSDNDPYKNGPDLDRARSLIAESGMQTPIQVEYLANTSRPDPTRVGEVIREQLKEIGVELKITPLELSVWLERLIGKKYELTFTFNEKTVDPDNIYSLLFTSDAPLNVFGYSNKRFDKLIADGRVSSDEEQRKQIYADAREILFDDVPVFYTFYETPNYLTTRKLAGASARPNLELHFDLMGFTERR